MNIRELESLESRIKDARGEEARARGALEQIVPAAQKEFGVSTIAEAEAKEAELLEQAVELDRKCESELAEITAEMDKVAG